ncbi:hypothetical protein [Pseudoalteromonas galatheae]|uniref:hypothetical protein n=1 Tax=Pseudoalteromonas galatheae TaxID=579562 RepID=UPI0030CD6E62
MAVESKIKLSKASQDWLNRKRDNADADYFVPYESGVFYESDVVSKIAELEGEIKRLKKLNNQ